MKVTDALRGLSSLYIEAAPLIYYVEVNPTYILRMDTVVQQIDGGLIAGVSSTIVITEVLTVPLRQNRQQLVQEYQDILLRSQNFRLVPVSIDIAHYGAELHSKYNLRTPDALHVATAIIANCSAFLTNDIKIKRVTEIPVLVLDQLQ